MKQKTRKSITKRFRVTRTGKVLRRKSFKGHLNVGKSRKRLRRLKKVVNVKGVYAKKIKKALGVKTKRKWVAIYKKEVARGKSKVTRSKKA